MSMPVLMRRWSLARSIWNQTLSLKEPRSTGSYRIKSVKLAKQSYPAKVMPTTTMCNQE